MNLQPYLDFATEIAYRAGRITLGYFNAGVRPDYKADDTPVTAADRAAEEFIRAEIEKRYPTHAILGEEFGETIRFSASPQASVSESVSPSASPLPPLSNSASLLPSVPESTSLLPSVPESASPLPSVPESASPLPSVPESASPLPSVPESVSPLHPLSNSASPLPSVPESASPLSPLSNSAPFRWIIDPIDGTKSFLRGVPLYGVLIGLEIEGVIKVGAAYFPGTDEMLCAAEGLGAWWNGRRARVSEIGSFERAYICYTNERNMYRYGRGEAWKRINAAAYASRGWSDAYGYLCVATGRAEAMLDPIMAIWDCGPFPVIFQEAGGYFGSWDGREGHTHNEALACNAAIKDKLLEIIKG